MRHITRLENGLTVVTAEMPHMASVSLGLWAGVGGRYETESLSGVSHFIEHLLFKGTRRRSARQISEGVEGLGGYLNAFTSEEHTCFYAKAGAQHFEQLLDVLADMFLHAAFDPKEIDKERDVIKEEIAMYLDQPQQHVQELLNAAMWPGHPMGRSITGTEKSLDGIHRAELVAFLKSHYVASATVVAAAGNIQHEKVVRAVKKLARHFVPGPRPQYVPARSAQTKPTLKLHTKKTEQTQIAFGIRACSRHDDHRFALRVLNAILGENMSSRLFQTIREDQGLAYSIYSGNSFFDDAGDLVISAGLDTGNLARVMKTILREMKRLTEELVPAAELRRAREYLVGQLDLSLENSENQMMWLGEQWLGYGKIFAPEEVKKRLGEVKPAEIRAAARAFFRPDRYNLALVSPLKSADKIVPGF
ncbi:MAG TPA: pitrilysin family protein [Verrucomicrobiae bacterium]|jgi:predicted Zn-dependent peptidase|nr:pitrilysin family protein [Verrucomicrobiae bacterium]